MRIISDIISKKINRKNIKIFRLQPRNIQQTVIQVLGKKKIKRGAPFILEALESSDKKILKSAIWSAGRLKMEVATKKLQEIFKETRDSKIKRDIIWALSEIKGEENLFFLFQLLKNKNFHLKKSLYLAFIKFKEKAVPELIDLLKDKHIEIAQQSAEILSRIPSVEDSIFPLLRKEDKQVRRRAVYILGKTAHPKSVNYLIKALEDEDIGVKERAIKALGILKKKETVPYLVKFLKSKNVDLQKEAIKSLSDIGNEEALRNLVGSKGKVSFENYNVLNKSLLRLGYDSREEINKKIFNKLEKELKITQFSYLAEVPKGLEKVAIADIKSKYSIILRKILLGKIIFDYQGDIRKLRELKSVEKIYLFLTLLKREKTKGKFLDQLNKTDILSPLFLFKKDKNFSFFLNLRELRNFTQKAELSQALRQWLTEKTSWIPLSQGYNIEFKIFSGDKDLFLTLELVKFLDFRREWRKYLVSTSLEPSLAYLMCFLSGISNDDVFLDPMCGSGTIVIERVFAGYYKRIIGSDIDRKAIESAKNNLDLARKKVEIYQWDATDLPLKKDSVTKVVVNMPYGRRVGSHQSNLKLYPLFLKKLDKIVSKGGKIVILTQEKKLLNHLVKKMKKFLIERKITVNVGELEPDIFVLKKI